MRAAAGFTALGAAFDGPGHTPVRAAGVRRAVVNPAASGSAQARLHARTARGPGAGSEAPDRRQDHRRAVAGVRPGCASSSADTALTALRACARLPADAASAIHGEDL